MSVLRRPIRAAAVAAAAVTTLAAGAAPGTAAVTPCAGATTSVTPATAATASRATLCLVNRERAERGLVPLRRDAALSGAATRHAGQMVRQQFFDHESPDGSTLLTRVRATGYLDGAEDYSLGENLAWGTGSLATPQRIVASWMRSPGHRANILRESFREIGLGVAIGNPEGRTGGATYVHDFGRRAR